MIRRARDRDLDAIERIYADIHTEEEQGRATIGWNRSIYPVRQTAMDALARGDLFVMENHGRVEGTGIINQTQVDVYAKGQWMYAAEPEQVMVLHTLVISPRAAGHGLGRQFVKFYERYALQHGCTVLRIDTNARNQAARHLYQKLGYREADIVPCVFNGLEGVQLVLLEKKLTDAPIEIREMDADHAEDLHLPNEPFTLWGRMIPGIEDGQWSYRIQENQQVAEDCFPEASYDLQDGSIYLGAYDGDACVGLARLRRDMFRYLYLDDLKVKEAYRGLGVGSLLIRACQKQAQARNMQGVYTIAQDTNLSACLFYLKQGFAIGGFDNRAYRGTKLEGSGDIMFYLDGNEQHCQEDKACQV